MWFHGKKSRFKDTADPPRVCLRSWAPERPPRHVIWPSIIMCHTILTYQGEETGATVTPPVWQATADSQHTNKWLFGSAFLWNSDGGNCAPGHSAVETSTPFFVLLCSFVTDRKSWWVVTHFGYGVFLDYIMKMSLWDRCTAWGSTIIWTTSKPRS